MLLKYLIKKITVYTLFIALIIAIPLFSDFTPRIIIEVVSRLTPVKINYNNISGNLMSEIKAEKVSVKIIKNTVTADSVEFKLNLKSLLNNKLDFQQIKFDNVRNINKLIPKNINNYINWEKLDILNLNYGKYILDKNLNHEFDFFVQHANNKNIKAHTSFKLNHTNFIFGSLDFKYKNQYVAINPQHNIFNLKLNQPEFIKNITDIDINTQGNFHANTIAAQFTYENNTYKTCFANNLTKNVLSIELKKMLLNNKHVFEKNPSNKLELKYDKKLQSLKATGSYDKFEFLANNFPQISKAHALLNIDFEIKNIFNQPKLIVDSKISDISAIMPQIGIKLKPGFINITSSLDNKIYLDGKINLHKSDEFILVSGFISPFADDFAHNLNLFTNNATVINNDIAKLNIRADIDLAYDHNINTICALGDVTFKNGNLNLDKIPRSITKTSDLLIISAKQDNAKKTPILLHPDFRITMNKNLKFQGFGLQGKPTGKLHIYKKHKSILANGRVTIQKGTYELPGEEFNVEKGRILYPQDTSISNPLLDIKLTKKIPKLAKTKSTQESTDYIYVSGSLNNPKITDNGIMGDRSKAILQVMRVGGGNVTDFFKKTLKLQEFGFKENEDGIINNDNLLANKDFVVGKKIYDNTYLQFNHNIEKENSKIKLHYALNDIWSFGFETGNTGHGADLQFSFEK